MKTSVEINEDKIKLAKKLSHITTLRELIDQALDAIIAQARRQEMGELLGSKFFDGDLGHMRKIVAVLVDSSVWIAASDPKNEECLALKRMISKNEALYIACPIQVEICQGARSEEQFHRLWDSFLGFPSLEITERHWDLSAWNYFKCRKKGHTLSTLDCLIATLAADYDIPLWSLDKCFQKISPLLGFELIESLT